MIVLSALLLFMVKLVLKHLSPRSNAGWRIVFSMTTGSYLANFTLPLMIEGDIDPWAHVVFIMFLPFTAFCAIFFDIFGAICVKWFQARKTGQSNS
ncbi:MAG: hypothetical protein LBD67_07965 [Candidatus Accumulibacter sp.]|nr:hypothetical protein [Accumulibacter sp.]